MCSEGRPPGLPDVPSRGGPLWDQFRVSLRRGRKVAKVLAIIFVLLSLLVFIIWLGLDMYGSAMLTEAKAKAARLGIPIDPAPLRSAAGGTSDHTPAWSLYSQAFLSMSDRQFRARFSALPGLGSYRSPHPSQRLTAETLAVIRSFMGEHRELLELLRRAADALAERGGAIPLNRDLHHNGIPLLSLAAWNEADGGDGAAALARISDALAIIASADENPDFSALGRRCYGADILLADGLTPVLWRITPDNDSLRRLQERLLAAAKDISARPILFTEFAERIERCERRINEPVSASAGASWIVSRCRCIAYIVLRGVLKMYEARYISGALDVIAACEAPPPQTLTVLGTQLRSGYIGSSSIFDSEGEIPYMSMALVDAALARAKLLSAATALAALRFKSDRGAWPESLGELAPDYLAEIPTDPFSGQPLLYRVDGGGIVVYSVAIDGLDAGGYPSLYAITQGSYDSFGQYAGNTDDVGFRIWQGPAGNQ